MEGGRNNVGSRGGRSGGRGVGRGFQNQGGGGRSGNYQNSWGQGGNQSQFNQGELRSNYQNEPNVGQGVAGGGGRGWGQPNRPPAQGACGVRPPAQPVNVRGPPPAGFQPPAASRPVASDVRGQPNRPPAQGSWGVRQPAQTHAVPGPSPVRSQPPAATLPLASDVRGQPNRPPAQGSWGVRPPAQTGVRQLAQTQAAVTVPGPSPVRSQPPAATLPLASDDLSSKMSGMNLSAETKNGEKKIQHIKRPDSGGKLAIRSVALLVNHFPVRYDPNKIITHYDVDVKFNSTDKKAMKKPIRSSDLRLIRDKLFSDEPFLGLANAYDGEKNIFSPVPLPTGKFIVDIPEGEEVRGGSYLFTIKAVNELKLSNLADYMKGNLSYVPYDILMGMNVVMKENPNKQRICVGGSFYSSQYRKEDDLNNSGVAAYRGFRSSLKPTSQGLVMCLDYSTLALRKPLPVIDYLIEHIPQFQGANDVKRLKRDVVTALKGLKVRVIHRKTKQKYTISGLAEKDTKDSYFDLVDVEGVNPSQRISLVQYFKDKWEKDIVYQNIPCLEVGRGPRSNLVPMEFCVLVEGQRFDKDNLDKNRALLLKNLTLVKPFVRTNTINEMVRAKDGPCGDVTRSFSIGVDVNMTKVSGRVIGAPELKIGAPRPIRVDAEKCQWNLVNKSLVDGKPLNRWALLDFTEGDRYNRLQADAFVHNLIGRCKGLGIHMKEPLSWADARMNDLSSPIKLEQLFKKLVDDAGKRDKDKLQMIICVMTRKDPGYKMLKWISETKVGVITQCCLSSAANKGQDQYLANICLKINAKLGGNNFELNGRLPHFSPQDLVMFIGADVNHPAPSNSSSPSIAAVVATINWPAANRYAARVVPQAHRVEKIQKFGSTCLELVTTYAQNNNGIRPNRIVVFRDGVSDEQFDMVLGEELLDLKNAIYDEKYRPAITLVVAQKRHQTRLFVENPRDGGASGNVPPGTVVDTKIVHPFDFDFYLASHYGGIGTSKPTHYYVLWDENSFTSDGLQKMIYDMCFTFARCTKPVSLVPPVYYADLVAYRGRMFQEAMLESGPRPSPHGSRSPSPSSATPSFDASVYKMHSDLENIMFFV